MTGKVNKKLASRTGASITFALLIFLVCAALSSVIIAAATASSGRLSNMAENDQRYYSVTSAAGLVKELLDGKTVTITRVTVDKSSQAYADDAESGSAAAVAGYPETKEYLGESDMIVAGTLNSTQSSMLNDAAYNYYVYRKTLAFSNSPSGVPLPEDVSLTLTVDGEAGLKVNITQKTDATGKLTLTLSSTSPGEVFRQQYVFTADVISDLGFGALQEEEEMTDYQEEDIVNPDTHEVTGKTNSYNIVTTTTTTETFTITWTLTGVKTVPVAAAVTP